MTFIGPAAKSSSTSAAPEEASPSRPILTGLCYLFGSAVLALGMIGALFELRSPRPITSAIALAAGSLVSALLLFGLGQAVRFLARSASATERTADAAEKTARLVEREQWRIRAESDVDN